MKLSKQQKQVYDYLKANPGATIREIRNNTFPSVQKPCMRLAEMARLGVEVERLGRNRHREVLYAIKPLKRVNYRVIIENGIAREVKEMVEV